MRTLGCEYDENQVMTETDRSPRASNAPARDRGQSIQAVKSTTAASTRTRIFLRMFSAMVSLSSADFLSGYHTGPSPSMQIQVKSFRYTPRRSKSGVYSSRAEVRSWV